MANRRLSSSQVVALQNIEAAQRVLINEFDNDTYGEVLEELFAVGHKIALLVADTTSETPQSEV